jgi:3' terminal RNA ribose 2'-O-methyltransferase Hen1
VLDDAKHYWVSPDEIDKLLRAGAGWLAAHPAKEIIALRYLAHRRALAHEAMQRLAVLAHADDAPDPDSVEESVDLTTTADEDAELPEAVRRVPLGEQRRRAVLEALAGAAPTRVLDLGCGTGALLTDLITLKSLTEIVGVDISSTALQIAERRLRLDRLPQRQRDRIKLWQSALTYSDDRLVGFDAAILMEVIEHVDPPRLPALVASVFGHARPSTVIVTTPNVEYNARYETMAEGALRHHDHRFEWTRAEFAAWCADVGRHRGYAVELRDVGDVDPEVGAPTQLAIFTIQEAA